MNTGYCHRARLDRTDEDAVPTFFKLMMIEQQLFLPEKNLLRREMRPGEQQQS